jgi:sporulation protein YlmC with PRC-barrel domain
MRVSPEHNSAICARKVIGTNVEDASGNKLGEIEDVVLDKESNSIMFAVVRFGGFLGLGEKYHPLPWSSLSYEEERHAYVVPYALEQLRQAPCASMDELTQGSAPEFRARAYDFYSEPRYWE